jgi:hypothetical protein
VLRAVVLIGMLAGCDLVFTPGPPVAPDADIHDEDQDQIPDSVDWCPHIPDPVNPDGDGDGVGDPCDPEPQIPRQRRLYFNGFDVGLDRLVAGPGSYTFEVGQVLLFGIANDVAALYLPDELEQVAISTRYQVDAISADARVDVAVIAAHRGAPDTLDGVSSRSGRASAQPDRIYVEHHDQSAADDILGAADDFLANFEGHQDVIEVRHTPSASRIETWTGGIMLTGATAFHSGSPGIAAHGVDARFDYLFVVVTDVD